MRFIIPYRKLFLFSFTLVSFGLTTPVKYSGKHIQPSDMRTAVSGPTGAGQFATVFSPYTPTGTCMSQDEITKKLQVIRNKKFERVRFYSTDCNSLDLIGSACRQLGLKMIVGVLINSAGLAGAQKQVDAIAQWADWDMVELIVVGNEAVFNRYCTAADLAAFINSSRSTFQSAGYTGNVTTAEPIEIWNGTSTLCSAVDVVGGNLHPFFNSHVTAANAYEFVLSEYRALMEICGMDALILETGWPNKGDANGAAIPGINEQKNAIYSIIAQNLGKVSTYLSYFDEAWKDPGPFKVGQHWGDGTVFKS